MQLIFYVYKLTVATKSGNQMMTYYHPGVYYSHGSHHSEQWSCCNGTTKKQKGCKACHAYSTPAEPSASPVTKQTIADVNGCSHDSRRHSSTSSVETVGGESLTSSSSCYSMYVQSINKYMYNAGQSIQTYKVMQCMHSLCVYITKLYTQDSYIQNHYYTRPTPGYTPLACMQINKTNWLTFVIHDCVYMYSCMHVLNISNQT